MRLEEAEESFYMMPTESVNFAPAGDLPAERLVRQAPAPEGVPLPGGADERRLQEVDLLGVRTVCLLTVHPQLPPCLRVRPSGVARLQSRLRKGEDLTVKVFLLFEFMAAIIAVATAVAFGYERLVERIPPLAEKTITAVRSVRAVLDEMRSRRE
ncbi:hypothetical protein AB0420_11465 [Streptomyces caelestis]|uniref:Uncharacterized protein n=1 Tax=Streptomyces heliomycini TaxID=284032 RepID=A0ABV5LBG6_9ACTN